MADGAEHYHRSGGGWSDSSHRNYTSADSGYYNGVRLTAEDAHAINNFLDITDTSGDIKHTMSGDIIYYGDAFADALDGGRRIAPGSEGRHYQRPDPHRWDSHHGDRPEASLDTGKNAAPAAAATAKPASTVLAVADVAAGHQPHHGGVPSNVSGKGGTSLA